MIKVLAHTPEAAFPSSLDICVFPFRSAGELWSSLTHSTFDVVLSSLPISGMAVEEFFQAVQRLDRNLPIVILQPTACMDQAIRLTKLGAYYVLPVDAPASKIHDLIRSAAMTGTSQIPEATDEPWRQHLIGNSPEMQRVAEIIRLVGARRSTVLITGETGTGKEMVARAIHMASGRAKAPIVSVNCSAIPENLLEAELFGHVKGAFTGATQARVGRFEQADGGTIFLDEIGDFPLELQPKLLRVLQEREIQKLGSSDTLRLNVRVVAATNVHLEEKVRERRFREDLFYRLNVVPLPLPALRERREDIPVLAQHFVEKVCDAEGLPPKQISDDLMRQLTDFDWPGNVRQLEHTLEMAVVLSGSRSTLLANDCRLSVPARRESGKLLTFPNVSVPDEGLSFDEAVTNLERSLLEQALVKSGGNKARAADLLRMKRTTLLAKLKTACA